MFMRFLGIGIGHCNQYSTEAGQVVGSDEDELEFMNDNESDGNMDVDNAEDGGGIQDSDDEEDLEGSDLNSDDEEYDDIGYDDL